MNNAQMMVVDLDRNPVAPPAELEWGRSPWLSFSGHRLHGDNLVRFVYLDEAGISKPKQEPWVVVAGFVLDADKQLVELEDRLAELHETSAWPFPVFHAKDLLHGGKVRKDPDWPKERRWEILRALAAIPRQMDLAVLACAVERARYPSPVVVEGKKFRAVAFAQSVAFAITVIHVERQMQRVARNEIAQIVCEDNDQARQLLKTAQRVLQDREVMARVKPLADAGLPLSSIRGVPHFCEKTDSSPLQLADTCAYGFKRWKMGKESFMYDEFKLQLVSA